MVTPLAILKVPAWLEQLGTAAWISTPGGRLAWMNDRARSLLQRAPESFLGLPCHQVVAATDPWGNPLCCEMCPIRHRAALGRIQKPLRMCIIDSDYQEHWLRVLVLDLTSEGQGLVHCALDSARTRRMEEYLEALAPRHRPATDRPHLTCREQDILQRLEQAQPLQTIATRLGLSYATVRNHVQHILSKLDAHSIQEAVALDLLGRIH